MSIKAGKSRASSGGGSTNRALRASASRRPSARAYRSGLQARLSSPAGESRKWNQAQHSHRIRQGESIAAKPSDRAHRQAWERRRLLSRFSPALSVCFKLLFFEAETSGLRLLSRGYATNPREQGSSIPPGGGGGGLRLSECLLVPLSCLELREACSSRVTPSHWDPGTLRSGHEQPCGLQGPVQDEDAGSLFKIIRNFKAATAKPSTKQRPLCERAGPMPTKQALGAPRPLG